MQQEDADVVDIFVLQYLKQLFVHFIPAGIGDAVAVEHCVDQAEPLHSIFRKKLSEAKRLLESTGLSVSAVENTLAFSSESHFISVFRRQNGLTPKEYRRYASRLFPGE